MVEIHVVWELLPGEAGERPMIDSCCGVGGCGYISGEEFTLVMALGDCAGEVAYAGVLLCAIGKDFDGVDAVNGALWDVPASLCKVVVSEYCGTRLQEKWNVPPLGRRDQRTAWRLL